MEPATPEPPTIVTSPLYDRAGLRDLPTGGPIVFMSKPFDINGAIAPIRRMTISITANPEAEPNATQYGEGRSCSDLVADAEARYRRFLTVCMC